MPSVVPFPVDLPGRIAPVAWSGSLCPVWVQRWGLGYLPPVPLAVFRVLPFRSLVRLIEPSPGGLRHLRANRLWLRQVLTSVDLLLTRACTGVPVLLRFGVPAAARQPVTEWLRQQVTPLDPVPNCFTLEFI